MAKAWRKNNERGRRIVALETLRSAVFTEKVNSKGVARTEDKWRERVNAEIKTLEKLV